MKKTLFFFLAGILILFPISFAFAVGGDNPSFPGGDTGVSSGNGSTEKVILSNPLGSIDSFPKLIGAILNGAFIIGVPIAVLFVVIAGFRFVLARGNPEQLKKAKTNMLYTIVGIAVFFGAWLITNIIVSTLRAINVSI